MFPGRGDPSAVAAALFQGLREYLAKQRHRHLRQVTVVVYQPEHLSVYQRHVKSDEGGFLSAVTKRIGGGCRLCYFAKSL
jgi:hypothetical protein